MGSSGGGGGSPVVSGNFQPDNSRGSIEIISETVKWGSLGAE